MSDATARGLTARPTVYNGTHMRSRLEARYAAWLDELGVDWVYEPNAFASPAGQYLPDFRIDNVSILGTAGRIYVEVKPTQQHASSAYRLMNWTSVWASEPDAWFAWEVPDLPTVLVTPLSLSLDQHQIRATWTRLGDSCVPALVPEMKPTWWRAA